MLGYGWINMSDVISTLTSALEPILPGATLLRKVMPFDTSISLLLLNDQADGCQLDSHQVGLFWQSLPYWAFAWAAGQGLAEHILKNPELVKGKRVLDFGCGSGLVGIAAAKAGAKSVLCCDSDPLALLACKLNAEHNQVSLTATTHWCDDVDRLDCLLAGDVLYDLTSSGDLARKCSKIPHWVIAETDYQMPPWPTVERVGQYCMSTLPELDDFDRNLGVSVYQMEAIKLQV